MLTAGRLAGALVLLGLAGCVVPQPRGEGKLDRVVEPKDQHGYWLYLPKEYVAADEAGRAARRWPLVVSFHGLKPFDEAYSQAQEWEQEADRYGFIVVAPELQASDVLRFPVHTISPAVTSDEEATLAILDHVAETTHAEQTNVLSTGWSSGGYLAHYMLNRHPDRFTCLAVRQADFSSSLLDATAAARSRYHPILILNAQKDFPVVREESSEAISWYEARRYANFAWVEIKDVGHERTPDMAAAFFARVARVEPNKPPEVLVHRQAISGNPRGLALLAGGAEERVLPPAMARGPAVSGPSSPTRSRAALFQARPNPENEPLTVEPLPPPEPEPPAVVLAPPPTPPPTPPPNRTLPRSLLAIRVSTAIGTEPLALTFSADCPADWQRSASFLWTLDGDPIGQGINGQKTIAESGEHTLGLLVSTGDGAEHRAYRLIRVLPHIEAARSEAVAQKQ